MKQKINIAELLEDCPIGMKLYSPIFGEVYLDKIRPHLAIVVTTDKEQGDFKEEFLYDGRYGINGECMLFPSKGKTTWAGFVPPCKFKDGDIVAATVFHGCTWVGIFKQYIENKFESYCFISAEGVFKNIGFKNHTPQNTRLATEEEKAELFQAIKDNGYHWNAETKILEKLIEPKFKVGDEIVKRNSICNSCIVSSVSSEYYGLKLPNGIEGIGVLPVSEQDNYELLLNTDKFDIATLKPFDKVLVRVCDKSKWIGDFYLWYNYTEKDNPYNCVCGCWSQCVLFKGNEHLLGKTDDCDDFYKTWQLIYNTTTMTTSSIQWTIGVPTKPGRYIVTVTSPYGNLYTSIDIFDGLRWEYYNNNSIVAFCSTFDIKPYKPQQ